MILPDKGKYPITQYFNDICCQASYAQFGMKGHNGIDVATPLGTPLYAPISGNAQVLSDPGGFGYYVKISNSQFASVVVAHLSRFSIGNRAVTEGVTQIGFSGASGNVTGPHYHFGVKPVGYDNNNGFFGAVDPIPYLKTTGGGDMPTEQDVKYYYSAYEGNTPSAADIAYYTTHPWRKLADRALLKQGDAYKYQIAQLQKQIDAGAVELQPGTYKVT